MESDKADGEIFLFTSESVGEGHPGECCNISRGYESILL
jgi:S-adenosylmethionine synthetase